MEASNDNDDDDDDCDDDDENGDDDDDGDAKEKTMKTRGPTMAFASLYHHPRSTRQSLARNGGKKGRQILYANRFIVKFDPLLYLS